MTDERTDFLARRREGLGSTDSAAILGLDPYSGALSVYLNKVGEDVDREATLPMWLGLQLQRTVGELFVARTGKRIRAANIQYKHPVFPFIRAHLDFRVVGEGAILEAKTTHVKEGWGEEGSDVVPIRVWCQVQHQMMVTGLGLTYVGALFGHYDFRYYEIARDEGFIADLTPALVEFWEQHVVPRIPPAVDGSEGATAYIKRKHPRDTEPAIPATPEQALIVEELIRVRQELKLASVRDQEMTNRVADLIGEHGGLIGPGWSISYRKGKPRHITKWKEVVADLAPFVPEGDYQATVDKHTEEQEGTRPFLLQITGGSSDGN
jgi:putative phage-type endonuclease